MNITTSLRPPGVPLAIQWPAPGRSSSRQIRRKYRAYPLTIAKSVDTLIGNYS
jgi:hypothetical protein